MLGMFLLGFIIALRRLFGRPWEGRCTVLRPAIAAAAGVRVFVIDRIFGKLCVGVFFFCIMYEVFE